MTAKLRRALPEAAAATITVARALCCEHRSHKGTAGGEINADEVLLMLRVGIDWSATHHDVCLLPEGGEPVRLRVPDDVAGLQQLQAAIKRHATDPHEVQIAAEIGDQHLFIAALIAEGYTLYPINPKAVDRYRDRLAPAGSKDDRRDALVLAEALRTDVHRLRPLRLDSDLLGQIRVLYGDYHALLTEKTRLSNQLTQCLRSYYPRALELFSRLDQPITWAVLRTFPTPSDLAQARRSKFVQLLKKGRYPGIQRKADELARLAREPQLPVNPAIVPAKVRRMRFLVDQLERVNQELNAYRAELERLVFQHPDRELFQSLKGVGAILTAGLLLLFGEDRAYVPHAGVVQCKAGSAPVTIQSNKTRRVHFRRACDKQARNTVQQLGWQLIKYHDWASELYTRHRQRGRTASEACRVVSNQALRLLYALWRDRKLYDPEIYQEARRQRQQPKAA